MRYALALLALLGISTSAAAGCQIGPPPKNPIQALGRILKDTGEGASPREREPRQKRLERENQQRTTYQALLTAGAPDEVACAAALNPQVLQAVAPTYFGRTSR